MSAPNAVRPGTELYDASSKCIRNNCVLSARPEYRWDRGAARYRSASTGRFIPPTQVRAWLDTSLDAATRRMDGLATALRSRKIDLISWEVAMRREVKTVSLYSAAAVRGGWAQMSDADYGRVGQYVRTQYEYLNSFARDVATGKQALDGRLNSRAQLYGQAGRPLYMRMERAEQRVRGIIPQIASPLDVDMGDPYTTVVR